MTRQRLTQSHLVKTILYFHFLMINTYPFLIKKMDGLLYCVHPINV
jgi:hypothetical protein